MLKRGIQDTISWNWKPWAEGSKRPHSGSATSRAEQRARQRQPARRLGVAVRAGGEHRDPRDDRNPDDQAQKRQTEEHELLFLTG